MTQLQLANALGVSKATVAKWELVQDRYPSGKMLPAVARALDCKVEDFY